MVAKLAKEPPLWKTKDREEIVKPPPPASCNTIKQATVQLRYIRTTHTRIIRSYFAYTRMYIRVYAYVYTRIRVCQYARICPFVMHSHKFLCMKHCWSNKGHMGMKRLQSAICILLKRHADQWKLSHFKFSITQIHRPFPWLLLDLKLPNRGRKLKQSLEIPILTRELYVFTRKDPCLGKERSVFQVASRLRNIFCLNSASLKSILIAKIISPVIFDTDHSFKRLNALFLTKNLFIEVFMMRRSRLVIFLLQGKVLCFARVIKSLARCLSVGSVRSTLSKKFYLWFFLTQIVHSKR